MIELAAILKPLLGSTRRANSTEDVDVIAPDFPEHSVTILVTQANEIGPKGTQGRPVHVHIVTAGLQQVPWTNCHPARQQPVAMGL
jgi:hypothetical protein